MQLGFIIRVGLCVHILLLSLSFYPHLGLRTVFDLFQFFLTHFYVYNIKYKRQESFSFVSHLLTYLPTYLPTYLRAAALFVYLPTYLPILNLPFSFAIFMLVIVGMGLSVFYIRVLRWTVLSIDTWFPTVVIPKSMSFAFALVISNYGLLLLSFTCMIFSLASVGSPTTTPTQTDRDTDTSF